MKKDCRSISENTFKVSISDKNWYNKRIPISISYRVIVRKTAYSRFSTINSIKNSEHIQEIRHNCIKGIFINNHRLKSINKCSI